MNSKSQKVLALDIGNTQIHGGVFEGSDLKLSFRKSTKFGNSSDELGLFLRTALRENGVNPDDVKRIAMCSVVPDMVHSIRNACLKYFDIQPFMLQAGVKTGLKIKYRNPLEVGADRIANAIGGTHLFPDTNLVIIDLGTATTVCVINRNKEYLGGLILPGIKISMEALESKTARLPAVEILRPEEIVGRSTVENIQAGLYFGNLHALCGITREIEKKYFPGEKPVVIGAGGFSRLFENEKVFDSMIPELVLIGVHRALLMNEEKGA